MIRLAVAVLTIYLGALLSALSYLPAVSGSEMPVAFAAHDDHAAGRRLP